MGTVYCFSFIIIMSSSKIKQVLGRCVERKQKRLLQCPSGVLFDCYYQEGQETVISLPQLNNIIGFPADGEK